MVPEIVIVVLRMSRVVGVQAAPGNVHGPVKVIGAAARPTIISVPVPLKVCQEFAIVIGPVAKAVVVESVAGVASTMLDTETVIGPVPKALPLLILSPEPVPKELPPVYVLLPESHKLPLPWF